MRDVSYADRMKVAPKLTSDYDDCDSNITDRYGYLTNRRFLSSGTCARPNLIRENTRRSRQKACPGMGYEQEKYINKTDMRLRGLDTLVIYAFGTRTQDVTTKIY